MATVHWQGNDGNWGNAANWSTGTVPADDDIVIFPRTATGAIVSGLDQSGILLGKLHIASGSTITIGGPNAPLIIGFETFQHGGGSDVYLQKWNPVGLGDLYLAADSPKVSVYHSGQDMRRTYILRGRYLTTGLAESAFLYVGQLTSPSDAFASLDSAGATSTLIVASGVCESRIVVQNAIVTGTGRLLVAGDGGFATGVVMGGLLDFEGTGGAVALNLLGGRTTFDDSVVTEVGTLLVLGGAKLSYDPDIVTVTTATNVLDDIGAGPVP